MLIDDQSIPEKIADQDQPLSLEKRELLNSFRLASRDSHKILA
jgi:hypothetical protein